jgi:hypothetical protein
VAGTTLLRVLLALVAAVTWCTTRGHSAPPGKIRNRSGCREIRIKFWDVEDGGTLLGDRPIEELKNPDNQWRTEEHRLLLASFRIRKDWSKHFPGSLLPPRMSSESAPESQHSPSQKKPGGAAARRSRRATGFALTASNSSSKSWIAFGVIAMRASVHSEHV